MSKLKKGFTALAISAVALSLFGCSNNKSIESSNKTTKTEKKATKKPAAKPKKKALTKKQKAKKKQKAFQLKDSQKSMTSELPNTPVVKDYVLKIKYHGDGDVDISVNSSFNSLTEDEKDTVAEKVNTFVTSYGEDLEAEADPYCFLTFTHNGSLVGHSKQFSHNEYKWQ